VLLFIVTTTTTKLSTTTSTALSTTTIPISSTTDDQLCYCECDHIFNITVDEIQKRIRELEKILTVNKEILSSTIRARTSADDPRPSSAYIGYTGVLIISVVFSVIFFIDFTNVYLFFKAKWNILIYCSWQSVQDWMIFHSLLKWFLYHGNKRKMNFLMFSGHIARRNIESGGSVVCCHLAFEVHPASWVQWSLHFIFIIRMTWYFLRLQSCT
jgi:hypothetical protein